MQPKTPLFTSDSQHPPRFRHAVYLGELGIFVFTFAVKRFHIYGALLHLALKVFTFTRPYYIFTFRGATRGSLMKPKWQKLASLAQ